MVSQYKGPVPVGPKPWQAEKSLAWVEDANCAGLDTNLFFPDYDPGDGETTRYKNYNYIRKVCAACRVRVECLEWALANKEDNGVWGGMTGRERKDIRASRNRRIR